MVLACLNFYLLRIAASALMLKILKYTKISNIYLKILNFACKRFRIE